MVERFSQGALTWVDLKCPTEEEIREVGKEFDIPPHYTEDLKNPVPRSTATMTDGAVKITMNFPIVKRTDIDHPHEIKFILTKDVLLTVHYEDMEAFDRFKKDFEVTSTLGKIPAEDACSAHIFAALLSSLYDVTLTKLDYLESQLNEIETEIFNQQEKEMVFHISWVSKKLITFRQTLSAHDDVLSAAEIFFDDLFGKKFKGELHDMHTHYRHILRRTRILFGTLDDLRDTNMALLTTKQNEIIKILTIMAFITFPLTLMTSLFGMNTTTSPIVGKEGDFWIIIGMMTVATVGFFTFFKYKDWI